jgi:hypothetical protein
LDKSRSNRVLKNVDFDALELFLAAHQTIIALVLPEGPSGRAKQPIGIASRGALHPPQHNGRVDLGCNQQVYMVGHHDPAVQQVIIGRAIADRRDHHLRDCRYSHVARTGTLLVQEAVQTYESFAGGQTIGKCPVERESVV